MSKAAVKNLDEQTAPKVSEKAEPLKPQNILGDMRMEEALEKQDKVEVMLEKRRGESPELDVTLNGVRYTVLRGKPVLVPRQVAEVIYERLRSEGKLSQVSEEMMARMKKGGAV